MRTLQLLKFCGISLVLRESGMGNTAKNIKSAVAVKYGEGEPGFKATGYGAMAEKIINMAMENDIPVHEDAELMRQLSNLQFIEKVPEELHAAVADILSFIYRVNGKHKEGSKANA